MLTPRIIADLRSGDECADPAITPDFGCAARVPPACFFCTVEKLVEDFVAEKLSKQKRGAEGARLMRRDLLPKLGDRAAAGLTRRELQDEVIRPMLKRAPRGGTYLLSRIRCAYAFALVLFTGCRSGEVSAALWRDIDLERAVWAIRESKNGEPHDVMLPRQAVELLKARRALHDIFGLPSPMGGRHIAQKALGLAQYEARKETGGEPRADPIEVAWTVS